MRGHRIDKVFLTSVILLMLVGLLIFVSASMGLLARQGASFSSVVLSQIGFGLIGGSIAMYITSKINYKWWRKLAFWVYIVALFLTLLVFVPHVGIRVYGASRWIGIGSFSFQPAEFLKIGFIFYLAMWFANAKDKIGELKYGMLPFVVVTAITGLVMLAQPDTDTFLVMFFSGLAMLLVAGGKFRHVLALAALSVGIVAILAFSRPYIMSRIKTFLDPSSDPQGSSYQVQQSLIAIGAGEITGRGFGQSIQKYYYLPEPIGDSIFAVAGEEFGFIGTVILVLLFGFFALRGLKIAADAPDIFGGLIVIGIVILIISQSFINIGAMLGLLPLSGLPLIFVSHGGTALLFALAEVGIIFNVSKYQKAVTA